MNFDVIIGNPPYNNGLYNEFIQRFNSRYVVMVTPANWQAFESNTTKLMKLYATEIDYYISNIDIFPQIAEMGGINYFILDKEKTPDKKCRVKNFLKGTKYFNDESIRDISLSDGRVCLCNIAVGIIEKINKTNNIESILSSINNNINPYNVKISFRSDGLQAYLDNRLSSEKTDKFKYRACNSRKEYGYISAEDIGILDGTEKYKLVIHDRLGYGAIPDKNGKLLGSKEPLIYKPFDIPVDASLSLFESSDLNIIINKQKWLKTKFVRFLMFIGNVSSHYTNNSVWNYVIDIPKDLKPDYTDKDIYDYFNLSENERNCIEYTIKER